MAKNSKIIIVLVILILAAAFYLAFNWLSALNQLSKINDFESCAKAGYPIMESYPEQCRTADGRIFSRTLMSEEEQNMVPPTNCRNLCGNGHCEEIVCLGAGCPCAETAEFCPQDCPIADDSVAGLANPASVNCEKLGGKLEIRTENDGGQIGYCVFSDGQECEEWALFRNECGLSSSNQMKILEGEVTD